MARLRRFELLTSGSGDKRSIQLSYRRIVRAADTIAVRKSDFTPS